MHSAYLPALEVALPDEVIAYHKQWEDLNRRVQDDGRLCEHPAEFAERMRPFTEQVLTEASIKGMFDSLGAALTQATQAWSG